MHHCTSVHLADWSQNIQQLPPTAGAPVDSCDSVSNIHPVLLRLRAIPLSNQSWGVYIGQSTTKAQVDWLPNNRLVAKHWVIIGFGTQIIQSALGDTNQMKWRLNRFGFVIKIASNWFNSIWLNQIQRENLPGGKGCLPPSPPRPLPPC